MILNHLSQPQQISKELEQIKKYQKYVNTELDSCFCKLITEYAPVVGEIVPFQKVSGSMEVQNGLITVKPGQRVQINVSLSYRNPTVYGTSNICYAIKDITNNIDISFIEPVRDSNQEYEFPCTASCQWTNEATEACQIALYVQDIYNQDVLHDLLSCLTVQEIGRAVTIDPLEHANTSQGIEDAPVGHIMSHVGTTAPKHYLVCDGAEYNIEEYPYLAQHIKDNFGSFNHFGGDGEATFAVPLLLNHTLDSIVGDIQEDAYFPNMTGNNSPAPYAASASSTHSSFGGPYNVFSDNDAIWHSTYQESPWVMIDCGVVTPVSCVKITARHDDSTIYPWTNFAIYGSNDNNDFVTLETYAGISWKQGEEKTFNFSKTYRYRYYKFQHITSGYTALKQIKLFSPTSKHLPFFLIKAEPTYFMQVHSTNYIQSNVYSEEEQVVGRWIDGKPIYKRTLTGVITNSGTMLLTNANNIEKLIRQHGYFWNASYTSHGPIPWFHEKSSNRCFIGVSADNNVVCVNGNVLNCEFFVTIEYTKTTDEPNSFTDDMLQDYVTTEPYPDEEVTNAIDTLWQ